MKVVYVAIGLTVFFLLLSSIVMPNYNTTGSQNVAGTGMSSTTYTGLLLLVFVLAIIGIAMDWMPKRGK
jgi:hypothetical protein